MRPPLGWIRLHGWPLWFRLGGRPEKVVRPKQPRATGCRVSAPLVQYRRSCGSGGPETGAEPAVGRALAVRPSCRSHSASVISAERRFAVIWRALHFPEDWVAGTECRSRAVFGSPSPTMRARSTVCRDQEAHQLEIRLQILRDLLLHNWQPEIKYPGHLSH